MRKPTKLPTLPRTRWEKASIFLAAVYIASVLVVILDVVIWRP